MAFDVAPEPLRRRGQRVPAIVVLAVAVGVVIVALATSSNGQPAPSAVPIALVAPTTRTIAPTAGTADAPPNPAPSRRGGRLPFLFICHSISDAICDAVASASIAVLPADAPPVMAIDAWGSLLCGDTLDCPPQRLAASDPLGSAVVSFRQGLPKAWVNVVQPSPGNGGDGTPRGPVAWIVRWRP